MATRCCWPPESWFGSLPRCALRPMRSRIAATAAAARAIGIPAATSGMAAFSAAVNAGSRLYCWKMKPTLLRRKPTLAASDICVIRLPQTSTSPLVGVRIPAIIEIRVVLPQPDGPTSIVSSPAGASKSIPCNTSTVPSPAAKDLVTLLQRTAMAGSVIGSASEDDRGVHHHDLAQAGKARDHDDHQNGAGGPDGHLPRQLETAKIDRDARGDFEKDGAQPDADRVADAGDDHGLQQHHAQDRAVGYSHGLERAELAQIFKNEDVEGLADHGGADDEAKRHGDAEIDRNAGSF